MGPERITEAAGADSYSTEMKKNNKSGKLSYLVYLRSFGLKDTILSVNLTGKYRDNEKNEETYAELVQFLDDKRLSLIMREAADNGRKVFNILRGHFEGKGKQRVISLYTQLTSLKKDSNESVTDYVIRTETILIELRNAG